MTISVKVSCNGRYRCPVVYQHGDDEPVDILLDGSTTEPQPHEVNIPYYHQGKILNITVGPEEAIPNEE